MPRDLADGEIELGGGGDDRGRGGVLRLRSLLDFKDTFEDIFDASLDAVDGVAHGENGGFRPS